jgi:hypothetical protein
MIIEFPKKYHVEMRKGNLGAIITVPSEYTAPLIELLKQQPWVAVANPLVECINVYISKAYRISSEEAYTALSQLCEFVMSSPPEVDKDVWGDVLGQEGLNDL